jgi:hypothetical protein
MSAILRTSLTLLLYSHHHDRYFQLKGMDKPTKQQFISERRGAYTSYVPARRSFLLFIRSSFDHLTVSEPLLSLSPSSPSSAPSSASPAPSVRLSSPLISRRRRGAIATVESRPRREDRIRWRLVWAETMSCSSETKQKQSIHD